ncbi:MAG: hypothetical protein J5846_02570, partial [Desulfovibrio sp.]|nr:hypothetical protein [Desulfovibrio sp.]
RLNPVIFAKKRKILPHHEQICTNSRNLLFQLISDHFFSSTTWFWCETTLRHRVTTSSPLERNRKRPIRISPNRPQLLTFSGRDERI